MPERFVGLMFQLDTNRINASGRLGNMNQLERWYEDGVIHLEMSETAQNEALAGGNAARARKAGSYIFSESAISTRNEQSMLRSIEKALSPTVPVTENDRHDVEIVFNARKYGCILVTADGGSKRQPRGILGSKQELAALGIRVMTDEQAVALVRERIKARDENATWKAREFGLPLPDWVGRD